MHRLTASVRSSSMVARSHCCRWSSVCSVVSDRCVPRQTADRFLGMNCRRVCASCCRANRCWVRSRLICAPCCSAAPQPCCPCSPQISCTWGQPGWACCAPRQVSERLPRRSGWRSARSHATPALGCSVAWRCSGWLRWCSVHRPRSGCPAPRLRCSAPVTW